MFIYRYYAFFIILNILYINWLIITISEIFVGLILLILTHSAFFLVFCDFFLIEFISDNFICRNSSRSEFKVHFS